MEKQGIIYSDITRGGGGSKTYTPHSVACYKSILHMGFHTSQSSLLKKALIIVKLIAHKWFGLIFQLAFNQLIDMLIIGC